MRTIFLLLFASLLATNAKSDIVDTEPFKKSALYACSREPTPNMRKNCVLSATRDFVSIKEISKNDMGQQAIKLCLGSLDMSRQSGVYDLVKCSVKHDSLKKNHLAPIFVDWIFKLDKLRPEWLKQCLSSVGKDLSRCMSLKESGFYAFWSEYIKISDQRDLQRITKCLALDFKTTQFDRFPVCAKI